MLVYIPYHISSFILPKKGEMRLAYSLPSIDNVDKIIVANEFLREAAILDGVPKEKLLLLDHPKLMQWLNLLGKMLLILKDGKKN